MKRMYILVLEDIPLGLAMAAVGHAAVACTLKFLNTKEIKEWLDTSFRKVICKVTMEEFNRSIDKESDYSIVTELNLNNKITAVAFKPRDNYHKIFKYLSLYKEDLSEC